MSKPYKRILTIDFETRWDSKEYTLSKLTTEEYIRNDKFKAFGACIHEFGTDKATQWYGHDELPRILSQYDWASTAVLAHNAQFDVSILEWVYGAHPSFIFDSLSMARALRGVEVGNSLAKLAEEFGLPPKGRAVHSTDGMEEISWEVEKELAQYCIHDVFLCEEVFKRLMGMEALPDGSRYAPYPKSELRLIDMTLKMYTRPQLLLDQDMLAKAIDEERETREELLARLNVDDSTLASNPKFAELLVSIGCEVPYKKSKTTGKQTLALAKNDALFQALLNSEREDVSLLCEARLRVKSTTERTRAQRFLDISERGALPIPLSYYGARSGRWTAAKGSAINMQNLKRGSFLRNAILAPEGHVVIAGDLSQIEPRVLAWMADYHELLAIFKSGKDAYAQFGAQMFNIPGLNKEDHPDLRQSAKSALLGCFGADTPVLTQRGWVPIVRVQATDTIWDGKEWVQHQGLVPQGEKEVLTQYGISATSDHEILTGRGWAGWSEVLANPSLLRSGLSLASLPVSDGSVSTTSADVVVSTPSCAVLAGGKGLYTEATSYAAQPHAVINAPNKKLSRLDGSRMGTSLFAQTVSTVIDCLTGSAQLLFGALTQTALRIRTTGEEALRCTLRGLKTVSSSCATWLDSTVGTSLHFNLTASTTTVGTSPATFGLPPAVKTAGTNDLTAHERLKSLSNISQPLKQRMQTYDLAYAGPRNRYTILTSKGPLIVHNCGYGLGWASFAAQLLVGFLGAPPVRYDAAFAKKLGVTREYIDKFLSWEDNVVKLEAIPHTCTTKELLIHCVAAKKIIDIYRATAHPVTSFWEMCDNMLHRCLVGGEEFRYKCIVFRKGEIELPNGMKLLYPDLRKDKEGSWVYGENATKLYAGKITNNIIQALARIVMTDGMLRVNKRLPVVGTVHDELWTIAMENVAEESTKWVLEQMIMEPPYMPGIPLNAEVGFNRRYGMAKK